ncbi:protein SPMIP1 isoform X1 [Brachyhypopomus gauderio]|uniref:protein SPMIP1 isoform X1 n=1 Tax=Brachyhypopomus gauderio TaxID=698409 RepID=UPI004041E5E0
MRDLLTTQTQNCYREQIMKEAYTRLTWKKKYGKDYPTSSTARTTKATALLNPAAPAQIFLPPVVPPPGKKREPLVPVKCSLSEAPLMRPVSPKTRETLYNGFSKEGRGRIFYLKSRVQKGPEERFDYPILSSWEYGWRLGDYINNYRSPSNGRSEVVKSTFYARNGIFNIPSATDHLG